MILALFVVRVRRPLKRHVQMEVVKFFMDHNWRGFTIRSAVKAYVTKIKIIQRAFLCSAVIKRIVVKRLIVPQVWAMETRVIGETAEFSEVKLKSEMDSII